ncbi:MAG: hypothetical protein ACFB8W_10200 [Elainellaceae cyanobacterium]
MLHRKPHILLGSALAVITSLGVAHRAIALPGAAASDSQSQITTQDIAQEVDPMQVRVPATVIAVDPDFGEVRVDLEDGTVDTIYLSNADINELGLDVGEEVTVIYQDDDAIALIRGDEVVTLNPDFDAQATTPATPSTDVDEPDLFEEDEAEMITEPEVSQETMMQREETMMQREETFQTTPTTTAPAAAEPVQGLW